MVDTERQSLYNVMIRDNRYTTDNNTLIDHIYTNITNMEVDSGNLETYFSDHKAIWISCKRKWTFIVGFAGKKIHHFISTVQMGTWYMISI